MTRSNCLFWAIAAKLRFGRRVRGRRVHMSARLSDWGPFPHFGIMVERRDGAFRFVSYKPKAPRRKGLPPPLFAGCVRWGD